MLVGDAEDYGTLLQMMLNALPLPATARAADPAGPGGGTRPPALGVAALPDTAQICSCNNVSKGDLCAAIGGGLHHARRAEEGDQGGHAPAAAARRWSSRC